MLQGREPELCIAGTLGLILRLQGTLSAAGRRLQSTELGVAPKLYQVWPKPPAYFKIKGGEKEQLTRRAKEKGKILIY